MLCALQRGGPAEPNCPGTEFLQRRRHQNCSQTFPGEWGGGGGIISPPGKQGAQGEKLEHFQVRGDGRGKIRVEGSGRGCQETWGGGAGLGE